MVWNFIIAFVKAFLIVGFIGGFLFGIFFFLKRRFYYIPFIIKYWLKRKDYDKELLKLIMDGIDAEKDITQMKKDYLKKTGNFKKMKEMQYLYPIVKKHSENKS